MAVVLEFHLICKRLICLEQLLQNAEIGKLKVSIDKISSIDNWMWENQQELESASFVNKALTEAKIVVIHLRSAMLKDLGIC